MIFSRHTKKERKAAYCNIISHAVIKVNIMAQLDSNKIPNPTKFLKPFRQVVGVSHPLHVALLSVCHSLTSNIQVAKTFLIIIRISSHLFAECKIISVEGSATSSNDASTMCSVYDIDRFFFRPVFLHVTAPSSRMTNDYFCTRLHTIYEYQLNYALPLKAR